jgi:hypothetical protein
MLFCKDVSATILVEISADIAAVTDTSPTTLSEASLDIAAALTEASADIAAALSTNSVERLAAIESSPATLEEASVESTLAISVDKAVFNDKSAATLEEASEDKAELPLVSIDAMAVTNPSMSAITIPTGAVICALSNIKSDCLFNTIFVLDIKKNLFFYQIISDLYDSVSSLDCLLNTNINFNSLFVD